MPDYILTLLKPEVFIVSLGPWALAGITAIVFAESGLFFGFFLPGDSLLFTAGLLASQGYLNFATLLLVTFPAAVLGDNVGYWFGHKVGPKIFAREDSLLFKKHHLLAAQKFYEKHGTKTIVLARFVPFVRTFAPIVAGAAQMHYSTFMTYNLIGGLLWTVGISSLGYFLGNIPWIHSHYEAVILLIIFGSIIPIVLHFLKDRKKISF
ncbi:MAG: hypothetical protein UX80_C0009G0003 [Candidatus Amesbacteria bacterium GW2011_GWA2_47_11b]|uniref:VTT domain-containing protein n=3 Tax=Candidatus Amesiibacteriota TaxID=1752730 RepID=A0A0G1SJX9_9BACT|nr:MAG: hypothetical protein UX42_C0009G0013 [Microgenomates group bacterium GW2011_GWC1_46_20]KKU57788.1 MAG: hypothetical protein UX80_C0009G0003 [Candidatus Amesbacteria bacterium GW2011_GWA2_47_11b]KKU69737.1 MAG: hypothetical protein UX92_C0011G0004 [Candidatus Amesbacteria bacterium GW2011_GWA1_47_20]KKU84638.1 MAG: hypothetical protein UY11_C0005G0012 [Candidatus Amesbacteria bacterium GW2011_GWC2_47_8]